MQYILELIVIVVQLKKIIFRDKKIKKFYKSLSLWEKKLCIVNAFNQLLCSSVLKDRELLLDFSYSIQI